MHRCHGVAPSPSVPVAQATVDRAVHEPPLPRDRRRARGIVAHHRPQQRRVGEVSEDQVIQPRGDVRQLVLPPSPRRFAQQPQTLVEQRLHQPPTISRAAALSSSDARWISRASCGCIAEIVQHAVEVRRRPHRRTAAPRRPPRAVKHATNIHAAAPPRTAPACSRSSGRGSPGSSARRPPRSPASTRHRTRAPRSGAPPRRGCVPRRQFRCRVAIAVIRRNMLLKQTFVCQRELRRLSAMSTSAHRNPPADALIHDI